MKIYELITILTKTFNVNDKSRGNLIQKYATYSRKLFKCFYRLKSLHDVDEDKISLINERRQNLF